MNTETENLSTDESLSGPEAQRSPAAEFIRPQYSFKNQPLRPYSSGTDMLFKQVLDRNDASLTLFLSFIFLHLQSNFVLNDAKTQWIASQRLLQLCWNKDAYRAALVEWVESLGILSDKDKVEATKLFEKIRHAAGKSAVETQPDPTQKKTRVSRRTT